MSKISLKATKKQLSLISKIWARAENWCAPIVGREDLFMDLIATNANGNPLDFEKLANFDDFNLLHDIYGIRKHLDRKTGRLMDNFLPRCSLPEMKKNQRISLMGPQINLTN